MRAYLKKISGFTLIELMLSMVVLVLLLLAVTNLLNSATSVTNGSLQRIEMDSQARVFLDRLQQDLSMMPKREDFDYLFIKADGAGGKGANDRFFFYSSAPGYSGGMLGATFGTNPDVFLQQRNPTCLIGYQIDEQILTTGMFGNFQARRFGDASLWIKTGTSFKGVNPLSYSNGTPFTPDLGKTILGNYAQSGSPTITITGPPPPANPNTEKLWPLLAPDVFRLEFCYLLKDGTYSVKPIMMKDASGATLNNSFSNTDPKVSDNSFGTGARWWNDAARRAFICSQSNIKTSPPDTASSVWKPYGLGDVAGIVVSIGLLDVNSRKIINGSNAAARWQSLMTLLPDPQVNPATGSLLKGKYLSGEAGTAFSFQLPAQLWSQRLSDSSSYQNTNVPASVISQVRVYQRVIYLR